jgi:hypothetical protein
MPAQAIGPDGSCDSVAIFPASGAIRRRTESTASCSAATNLSDCNAQHVSASDGHDLRLGYLIGQPELFPWWDCPVAQRNQHRRRNVDLADPGCRVKAGDLGRAARSRVGRAHSARAWSSGNRGTTDLLTSTGRHRLACDVLGERMHPAAPQPAPRTFGRCP